MNKLIEDIMSMVTHYEYEPVTHHMLYAIQYNIDKLIKQFKLTNSQKPPYIKVVLVGDKLHCVVLPPIDETICTMGENIQYIEKSDVSQMVVKLFELKFGRDAGELGRTLEQLMIESNTDKITNIRVVILDDSQKLDMFVAGRGCCDSCEKVFVIGDNIYVMGFNFNHKVH